MNKIILIGRLTKDPVVKYTTSQKVVCQFTLAVDRPFKGQNGEQEADFLPIVLWGKSAELVGNSCAKGHKLAVEGRVQVRTYEDKETHKTVWITEVIGDRIEFLEKKADAGHPMDNYGAPAPNQNPYANANPNPGYGNNGYNNGGYNNGYNNGNYNNGGGYNNGGYNNGGGFKPNSPMNGMGTDVPFDEEVPF